MFCIECGVKITDSIEYCSACVKSVDVAGEKIPYIKIKDIITTGNSIYIRVNESLLLRNSLLCGFLTGLILDFITGKSQFTISFILGAYILYRFDLPPFAIPLISWKSGLRLI